MRVNNFNIIPKILHNDANSKTVFENYRHFIKILVWGELAKLIKSQILKKDISPTNGTKNN